VNYVLCQRILLRSRQAGKRKRILPLEFTAFISGDKLSQLQYCLEHLFEGNNKLDFLSSPALSEDSDLIFSHNSRRREE
jgi:hypothetical protein